MRLNVIGPVIRNAPFGTEIAFVKGLRQFGVEVNAFDPSPGLEGIEHLGHQELWKDVDATVVFKTAHAYNEQLDTISGLKIVYQPDDMRYPHIRQLMVEMRSYCDLALTFDSSSAEICKQSVGYEDARELIVTADPDLYHPEDVGADDMQIDVLFAGSMGGSGHTHRWRMIEVLRAAGVDVHVLANEYQPAKIRALYNRSKVVLNHATDVGQPFGWGYGYQCRHFEVGMTRSCLVSNSVFGRRFDVTNFVQFSSEEQLVDLVRRLLDEPEEREIWADALYDEMMECHLPVHRATEIVQFIEEHR